MKRIVSGLLALCLLCALPVTAAARSNPTLFCRERGGEVRLTLESLDRQAYALQLELVLEGECPEARFEPSLRGVYSPDCHVEAGRDETAVTLYLMAEDEPLSGRSLDLGTLMPGSDFRLPGRGELPAGPEPPAHLRGTGFPGGGAGRAGSRPCSKRPGLSGRAAGGLVL